MQAEFICLGAPGGLLGKPKMGSQALVGAALLLPPFGPSNTVWALTIDAEGLLRQKIQTWSYQKARKDEFHYKEMHVTSQGLRGILDIAHEIAFRGFPDIYEEAPVTDDATFWIAIRYESGVKSVEAYAPFWWAARGSQQMLAFLKLWGAIHQSSPFPSNYNDPDQMLGFERKLLAMMMKQGYIWKT